MFDWHNIMHFRIGRELSEIYISMSLRYFALSLIYLFVPLFLMQSGFSLEEIILNFYIIWLFLYVILAPVFVKLVSKMGLKHSMALSMPFLLAFFLLLYSFGSYEWPLPLLAVLHTFAVGFFWPALHIDFAKSTEAKNRGKEYGLLQVLTLGFSTIGPFLGGAVITYFGFKVLFLLANITLLTSVFPLFLSGEVHQGLKFNLRDFFKRNNIRPFITFFGEGITTYSNMIIWPIYMFLLLESYLELGMIGTVITFFTGVAMWIVAKLSDRKSRHRIITWGSVSHSLTFVIRMFTKRFLGLVAISSLSGITFAIVNNPFSALFYGKASKKNLAEFVLFREMFLAIGRIFILTVFLIFIRILSFPNSFILTFLVAAFGVLLYKAFK